MRFGRQRAPRDVATLALLLAGFSGLAVAFWMLTLNWAGILLPIGFLIGAWSQLRGEVRELELRDDTLVVRTFFREYPMPRAHVRAVVRTPAGVMVEVANGNRYAVTPRDVLSDDVARALEQWLGPTTSSSTLPSSVQSP